VGASRASQDHPLDRPSSDLLIRVLDALDEPRVSVGEVIDLLGDRAVGLLLLLLALPMCIPNVPGVSTLFGVLILAPAFQLLFALPRLQLPRRVRAWTIPRAALVSAINGAIAPLRRIEHHIRPRWTLFVHPPAEQYLALQTIVMALVLLLPIPGGNWPPGMTVAATGLAIVQRDGRLALLSMPMAAISVAIAWIGFRVGLSMLHQVVEFLQRVVG